MKVTAVSVLACVLVTLFGAEAVTKYSANCPQGYYSAEYNDRHCYKLIANQMKWTDALNYCQKQGGTLAVVHTLEEFQLILSMVKETQNQFPYAWVGLNDRQEEGKYVWTDGSTNAIRWSKTATFQQYGEEDCVVLSSFKGVEGFDDTRCDSGNAFICMNF